MTWRREHGGGPVLINAIHTIDDVRTLTGAEIVVVQALQISAIRGSRWKTGRTAQLEFSNGMLGTINISDTVAAPLSWQMTSGENPAYTHTTQACYLIGGTVVSLSIPDLRLWRHAQPSWVSQITCTSLDRSNEDPLVRQLQFRPVVQREVMPLVGGRDAMATLAATPITKREDAGASLVADF